LRVLQEHEFDHVGGSIRTNVRVIVAINRDLETDIAAGMFRRFRSDLSYRLSVFPIEIPPLLERREDIPPYWSGTSLIVTARKVGKKFQGVNQKKIDLLQSYAWPGSIREFQNVIERSVIVCETENFSVDDESWLLLMQASRKANWSYLESSRPKRKR
jgi:formate hydrogenlyase transcriptional activator